MHYVRSANVLSLYPLRGNRPYPTRYPYPLAHWGAVNTTPKKRVIRRCVMCPDTFMTVGSDKLRLARPMLPSIDQYGQEMEGKCPKHPMERGQPDNGNSLGLVTIE